MLLFANNLVPMAESAMDLRIMIVFIVCPKKLLRMNVAKSSYGMWE